LIIEKVFNNSNEEIIKMYYEGMTNAQIAEVCNVTIRQVNHKIDKLRRKGKIIGTREDLSVRPEVVEKTDETAEVVKKEINKDQFIAFMKKARNAKEVEAKFGVDGVELLKEEFPGFNWFKFKSEYNLDQFILLNDTACKEYNVQDKQWTYYHADSVLEGFIQPYQLVQLDDALFDNPEQEVRIIPIYDVHYGHAACKYTKFKNYVNWIADNDNVLTFLGGDIMENALDDGRGMTYSQSIPPDQQIEQMCELLAPIAHKILFSLPGNHCYRTEKRSGIDPAMIVAKNLKVPYFNGPVYCSILGMGNKWRMYAAHGTGGSQTKGGKLNAGGKARRFTDFINWYSTGHCHDPIINPETCIVEDVANCCLKFATEWTVIAPSFLHWEQTYAYKAEMAPPGKGGAVLTINADGNYGANYFDF
jgi:transposase